jgi:hypothetical protein
MANVRSGHRSDGDISFISAIRTGYNAAMKFRRIAVTSLLLIAAMAAFFMLFNGYLHFVSHGD